MPLFLESIQLLSLMVYVQLVYLLDWAGYPLVYYTGRARLKDQTIIECL